MANFIRNLLYKLKRNYGAPIDFYRTLSSVVDHATGRKVVSRSVCRIPLAIILPSDITRKFNFNLGYLAANKNFTYGALFDTDQVTVLLDNRDLPSGYELDLNDYAIKDHRRYELKQIETAEHGQSTLVIMRWIKGTLPSEIIDVRAENRIAFMDQTSNS